MKKILLIIGFCISVSSIFAQTQLTVGMSGAQVRTALNNNMLNPTVPLTTVSTTGVIYKGTIPWMHDWPGTNVGGGYTTGGIGAVRGKNLFIGKWSGVQFHDNGASDAGSMNTAVGDSTLAMLTHGEGNTAIGDAALSKCATGILNVAVGRQALYLHPAPTNSVAVGESAFERWKDGAYGVAMGTNAAMFLVKGSYNTLIGYDAGYGVSTPDAVSGISVYEYCTALGAAALGTTRSGSQLIAIGVGAMGNARNAGNHSIAIGNNALNLNHLSYNIGIGSSTAAIDSTGQMNIWLGDHTGYTAQGATRNFVGGFNAAYNITSGSENMILGAYSANAITTGSNNTIIGNAAGRAGLTTGSGNIFLGNNAGVDETGSNRLYIDNQDHGTQIQNRADALIYGQFGADSSAQFVKVAGYLRVTGTTSSTGTALVMGTDGRIYMSTSSREFKHNIKNFAGDYDAIMKVRPVRYQYIGTEATDIGYIAEEFQQLGLTNLLNYKDGKPFSIKYDRLPIYIIEILKKQQAKLDELEARIKALENK